MTFQSILAKLSFEIFSTKSQTRIKQKQTQTQFANTEYTQKCAIRKHKNIIIYSPKAEQDIMWITRQKRI